MTAPVRGWAISAEQFRKATGYSPTQDDLERSNCPNAGKPGHLGCGWDASRNLPNFIPSIRVTITPEETK
jgi:hypothetical protein